MFESFVSLENNKLDVEESAVRTKTRRYRAISDHLFSDLAEEAVILSLRNGKYYGVNNVGASIWSMIQKPMTLSEIEAVLMTEYAVSEDQCRSEVTAFLKSMIGEDLIDVLDE
jgi:hypothetical protein